MDANAGLSVVTTAPLNGSSSGNGNGSGAERETSAPATPLSATGTTATACEIKPSKTAKSTGGGSNISSERPSLSLGETRCPRSFKRRDRLTEQHTATTTTVSTSSRSTRRCCTSAARPKTLTCCCALVQAAVVVVVVAVVATWMPWYHPCLLLSLQTEQWT